MPIIRAPEAPGQSSSLEVAAASAIPMLLGPYVHTYSHSPWDPCGTVEEDSTKLVLGDLSTIILSFWGAHGQSTSVTVRGTMLYIFRETFLLLPAVRVPGNPAMVSSLSLGGQHY